MTHCITPPVAKPGERLPLSTRETELYSHILSKPEATAADRILAMGYRKRCGAYRRLWAGLREKGWLPR